MFEPERQRGVCGEQTALPTVLQWGEGKRVHRGERHSSWAGGLSWQSLSTVAKQVPCSALLNQATGAGPQGKVCRDGVGGSMPVLHHVAQTTSVLPVQVLGWSSPSLSFHRSTGRGRRAAGTGAMCLQ